MIKKCEDPLHVFRLHDDAKGVYLEKEGAIYAIELPKWQKTSVDGELDRWIRFLKEGRELDVDRPLS